jgi:ATP-dependent Lhr-like helicase
VYFTIGDETEAKFGRRHFMELSSVFTSSPDFAVIHGNRAIGTLDWLSLAYQDGERKHPVILAGRTWDIEEIDWNRRKVFVSPSTQHGKVRWEGVGRGLSFELAREVRELVLSDSVSERWTRRATDQMAVQREEMQGVAESMGRIVYDAGDDRVHWFTFAGSPLNELLGVHLQTALDLQMTWDDYCVSAPGVTDVQRLLDCARGLLESEDIVAEVPPSDDLAKHLKFSECLPTDLAHRAVLGRLRLEVLTVEHLLAGHDG